MSKFKHQAGFTILELMIATVVFSVILLLATYGIIQIGNRYYKATLQAQTQTATRNAIDEITRNIQFSSGVISTPTGNGNGGVYAYCINGVKYGYMPHVMQDKNGTFQHVFIVSSDSSCTLPDINDFKNGSTARDLLTNRMRIVDFSISQASSGGPAAVNLRVATGEADLLCDPSTNDNDCSNQGNTAHPNSTNLTCKGQTGTTYCAVSGLSTVVTPRLAP